MNIHSFYRVVLPWFRRRRMQAFERTFRPGPETRILDAGGLHWNWQLIGCASPVTLLNIKLPSNRKSAPANFTYERGNATSMAYASGSFDLVHSNSVIEHLGDFEKQKRFAAEVSRVGRSLWIQTPARGFFIEPHFVAPFLHFLPKRWQKRLARHFSLWGWMSRPDRRAVEALVDEIRLLTYGEMRALFPDCQIRKERFLFMTKAYIAVRAAAPTAVKAGSIQAHSVPIRRWGAPKASVTARITPGQPSL